MEKQRGEETDSDNQIAQMLHKRQHRLPSPIERKSHHQIFASDRDFPPRQRSPSRSSSVSDLTRWANCRELASCQEPHVETSGAGAGLNAGAYLSPKALHDGEGLGYKKPQPSDSFTHGCR